MNNILRFLLFPFIIFTISTNCISQNVDKNRLIIQNIDQNRYLKYYKKINYLNNRGDLKPIIFLFYVNSMDFSIKDSIDIKNYIENPAHYSFIMDERTKKIAEKMGIRTDTIIGGHRYTKNIRYTEKYIDETGPTIDTLKSYFPYLLLRDSFLYTKSIEYSFILQSMHEPILSNITDSLVVRMVAPDFSGAFGLKYFSSIRIHFGKDSVKVYKTKIILNKAEYIPIENYRYLVKQNTVCKLKKNLNLFRFNYPSLLFNPILYNSSFDLYPTLFEYKNGSEYHIYLIRDYKFKLLEHRDAHLFKKIIGKINELMVKRPYYGSLIWF